MVGCRLFFVALWVERCVKAMLYCVYAPDLRMEPPLDSDYTIPEDGTELSESLCVAVNERAIKFYEKYGFRFDSTEQEIKLGTPNTELRIIYERNYNK